MDNRPIGVFDSGLGGLTVVKEMMRLLPRESIVYFGDTGRVPYGSRSPETIVKYTFSDIHFLQTFDIKAIVIACGTASSVAYDAAKKAFTMPVYSVLQPTASAAAAATKNGKIGIIGTAGTIRSCSYQKTLAGIDPALSCFAVACPLFVPLVENGHTEDELARLAAKNYLAPLKAEGVDTLILGCTHYPLLQKAIAEEMGEGVTLINSGEVTARSLCRQLREDGLTAQQEKGEYHYYVSDRADDFGMLASRFLEREIEVELTKIEIEKY